MTETVEIRTIFYVTENHDVWIAERDSAGIQGEPERFYGQVAQLVHEGFDEITVHSARMMGWPT